MIEHRQQVEEIRKLIEYPDRKSSQLFAQCFLWYSIWCWIFTVEACYSAN